jgi:hypothetical protein
VATGIDSLGRLDAGRRLQGMPTRSATSTCATCSRGTATVASASPSKAEDVYLDYSKNRVTDQTLRLLVQLADERGLRQRIDAMFAGDAINPTEDRAVLHVALRAPMGSRIEVDGANVVAAVRDVLHDSSTNALIRRYRRHRNGAVLKEA